MQSWDVQLLSLFCVPVTMQLQRSDREDELNRKLTEYLQKLEDMTRQLGDINSRLQECEDNKVRYEWRCVLVGVSLGEAWQLMPSIVHWWVDSLIPRPSFQAFLLCCKALYPKKNELEEGLVKLIT